MNFVIEFPKEKEHDAHFISRTRYDCLFCGAVLHFYYPMPKLLNIIKDNDDIEMESITN